jgi:hypothetical protein
MIPRFVPLAWRSRRFCRLILTTLLALPLLALSSLTAPGLHAQQAPPPGYGQSYGQGYGSPSGYGQQPNYPQQNNQDSYDPSADPGQQPVDSAPYPDAAPQFTPQSAPQAPLNVVQLEQLVAPIALYPDTLVAQILAASTYPAQVVDADHWRQAQAYASPDQVVYGANLQSWDPSVKALTAFPQVLVEMDGNFRWMVALGNAYYNQPQDVLDVVQVMRQRAQAAGNLQPSPQESVTYDQGYIQLTPPDPQVVYLPAYNPWNVYGQPVAPYPGFSFLGALSSVGRFLGNGIGRGLGSGLGNSFGSGLGSSPISWGLGIAMAAFNHTPWGFLQWGLSWLGHSVLFHSSPFASQSTSVADWGLPHGGPRAYPQRAFLNADNRSNFNDRNNHFATPQNGRNYREQGAYNRAGSQPNSYTHLPGRSFVPENRNQQFAQHPSPSYNNGYRPNQGPAQAYNRAPAAPFSRTEPYNRTQPYSRPGAAGTYGSGYSANQGLANRPNPVFNHPAQNPGRSPFQNSYRNQAQPNRMQAYRSPANGFDRSGEFANRSADPYRGGGDRGVSQGFQSYSGKQPKFHDSRAFNEGSERKFKEPKMKEPKLPKPPKTEKGFHGGGGGHSHGGGLFGGHGGHR